MTNRVDTLEARLARLEARLARLEAQMAQMGVKLWALIVMGVLGLVLRVSQFWGQ